MDTEKLQLIIWLMWFGGFALGIAAGVMIGKYLERKTWNKLIDEGKIPRPKKIKNENV